MLAPENALTIRAMRICDVAAILRIQRACYVPHMNESQPVIEHRLSASPETAWVAERAGEVVAYLAAYPSLLGKVTSLGGHFNVPLTADCLYLHDLAVSPAVRRSGAGPMLLRRAWQAADSIGLMQSALVSVQDSRLFWEKHGYRVAEDLAPGQRDKLASYGAPCWYMTRGTAV